MITGFLLAYAFFTAPLIIWATWRAVQNRKIKEAIPAEDRTPTDLVKTVEEMFEKHGMTARVHEMPKDAMEAVFMHSHIMLDALRTTDNKMETWFQFLKQKGEESRRNETTIMRASEQIAKGMQTLASSLGKETTVTAPGNVDTFVNSLQYARDRFCSDKEKKVLDTIISNIKTSCESK